LFAGLIRASDAFRDDPGRAAVRFFVDDSLVQADVRDWLPNHADRTLTGYSARVSERLGGRDLGLVVNHYQVHDAPVWSRTRSFLAGLYAQVGVPSGRADIDVFVGTYRKTPFGLHRDAASNFCFVVDGHKRMRLWAADVFAARPEANNTTHYQTDLESSLVIDAEPGDVIYWPSSYWHCAESDGGLTVCLNVGLFVDADPARFVASAVEDALRARLGPGRLSTLRGPDVPARIVEAARTLDAARLGAERAVVDAWLTWLSSMAFRHVPEPRPVVPLGDDHCVRGDPVHPILSRVDGDEMVVSVSGHTLALPWHPNVPPLLDRLACGNPLLVGDLLDAHAGVVAGDATYEIDREHLRWFLERLVAFRGLHSTNVRPPTAVAHSTPLRPGRTTLPRPTDRLRFAGSTMVSPYCVGWVGSPAVVEAAFEAGINFFFVSADLHWPMYEHTRRGISALCRRGLRDRIVIGVASYVAQPEFGTAPFAEVLEAIAGLDRIDLKIAGGVTASDGLARLDRHRGTTRGAAIGASFHCRVTALAAINAAACDVAFVRYNARHPGARTDVFPHRRATPTLVYNFKSTGGFVPPEQLRAPDDKTWQPSRADHYRFVLSRPELDGVLCALRDVAQVRALADAISLGGLTCEEEEHILAVAASTGTRSR
jgi:hypothetical protein